jgi:hypothetical protein
MPYCPRCGVETDPSLKTCPLCETPLPVLDGVGPGRPAWPQPGAPGDPAKTYFTSSELRSRAFLFVSGVLLTAALVVVVVDVAVTHGFTWSRWPLASLAAVWALTASALNWHKNPRAWTAAWFVVVNLFLATLDTAGDGRSWYMVVGLPITAATFGLSVFGARVIQGARKGYNVFGLVPALVAVGLMAIDAVVTLWTTGSPGLGWSLVTDVVLLPFSVLFYFLHFTLPRTPDLRRIFHF